MASTCSGSRLDGDLVPGLLALVFGWLAFRSRVTGVYLSIITQALTYALMLAFFRNDMGFGGNNGLTDFKDILGFADQRARDTRRAVRRVRARAWRSAISRADTSRMSRAGRVVQAIRDAESRTRFIGYRVESYKLWMFAFSAVLAGIAGALYVPQVGIINPSEFQPINSIEVVIWVAVGGRGTLYGAVAGAVLVNYAKTLLHRGAAGVLAVCAGCVVRARHAVPAARRRRTAGRIGSCRPQPQRRRQSGDRMNAAAGHQATAGRRCSAPAHAASARMPGDASHGTILYLEDITVSFDGFKALNALTLYIDAGELRCIIGPNGAGKTTMMDVITGKTRPDAGSAWFGQTTDLLTLTEPEIAEAGIGRKFQKPTVFEQHTCSRTSSSRSRATKSIWHTLFKPTDRNAARAHRRGAGNDSACRIAATCVPACCRTVRSNGSRSACCSCRIRRCCWSTSPSPA